MKRLLLLFAFGCAAAFAGNNCAITLSANTNFSSTTAGNWTSCGSTTPQNGDNISVSGGYTLTLDTARTFGTGQAPYRGYPATISGSAGGSTTCGSAPSLGGTSIRTGTLGCAVVAGYCTPQIYDRGVYSATGTTAIASTCTGGSPTWTLAWNAGGGTPAIQAGTNTTVVIGAAVIARGDVLGVDSYCDATSAIRMKSGGSLTFDFSLSGANTPIYNLGVQGNAGACGRTFDTDGSCTISTCTITTTGGGYWRMDSAGNSHGPIVNLRYVTMANVGDPSTPAIYSPGTGNATYDGITLIGNSITAWAGAQLGNSLPITGGSVIDIEKNTFSSTQSANWIYSQGGKNAEFEVGWVAGTWDGLGTRKLASNVSDQPILYGNTPSSVTITGNVMSGSLFALASGNSVWAAFSNNVLLCFNAGGGNCNTSLAGNVDHNIWWGLDDTVNWHTTITGSVSTAMTYNIFGVAGAWSGDSGEIAGVAASNVTTNFNNNFILPDRNGLSWSEPGGSPENAGASMHEQLDHNYWYANYGVTNPNFGLLQDDEIAATPSGFLTSMKCNTMWNAHVLASSFVKIDDQLSTPTTQPGSANIDYNWGWGNASTVAACTGCTNQQGGYAAAWTTYTPGTHDRNSIDPGVDYTRRIETFPTDYLHFTASKGAWSSSTAYSTGDTVSDSQAGIFWGENIVYTCIASGGCAAGSARPASGTNWWTVWEPYGVTWLKNKVSSASTFIDGALVVLGVGEDTACSIANPCDAVTAMRHWIYAGAIHSNPQFWGACSDGSNIGPVNTPVARLLPLTPQVN